MFKSFDLFTVKYVLNMDREDLPTASFQKIHRHSPSIKNAFLKIVWNLRIWKVLKIKLFLNFCDPEVYGS